MLTNQIAVFYLAIVSIMAISFTHAVSHNVLHFCTLTHTVLKHARQRDCVREAKTHQTSIQLWEERSREERDGGRGARRRRREDGRNEGRDKFLHR